MKEETAHEVNKQISCLEAFQAMQCFLEKYYEQTKSDDVGSLLGGLALLENKRTRDLAAWYDWMDCINKVVQ